MPVRNVDGYIEEAIKRYGNKYDYSKVDEDYLSCNNPVRIKCNDHNEEFCQSMMDHARRGRTGCKQCIAEKRRSHFADTTAEFIEKAKRTHPNSNYDYSKVQYVNARTKIKIKCKDHGFFWQTPDGHLGGRIGCKGCASEIKFNKKDPKKIVVKTGIRKIKPGPKIKIKTRTKKQFHEDQRRLGKLRFIKRASAYHNDKYDYSEIVYVNCYSKMKIICPDHGEFSQTAVEHYRYGCRKCAQLANGKKKRMSQEDFINKAIEIHGDKYDYSKVKYITVQTKITIICLKHGEFEQSPDNHIYTGCGCPICCISKGELSIKKYLESKNIDFVQQKRFKKCFRIQMLPFDFFIPDLNLCIEYDGEQHFRPIEYFGGEESFIKTQESDAIKDDYCDCYGRGLIRIPYFIKDIEMYLQEKIMEYEIKLLGDRISKLEEKIQVLSE